MATQTKGNGTMVLTELPHDLAERGREVWLAGLGAVAMVEDEGAKLYNDLVERGRRFEKEGSRLYNDLVRRGREVEQSGRRQLQAAREDLDTTQKKWRRQVEDAVVTTVEQTLQRLDVPMRTEVQELSKQVDVLSRKIDKLADAVEREERAPVAPAPAEGGAAATAARTVYHVVPREDGWAVKKEGAERAVSVQETKDAAVERARELARGREPSRLVVHGQDGRIQETFSYDG